MAREIHRLTALAIAKKKKPGSYADGGGLCLQITETGSKSWIFRFMLQGRAREMGLGALHTVGLAEAREQARSCRALRLEGVDPIEHRRLRRAENALQRHSAKTFDQCASEYIAAQRPGWSNPKHVDQWTNTLKAYATPVFGDLPVQAVETELIVQALNKIWTTKTETATRVRQRIEAVLDWATVSGFRQGNNPARWSGHLEHKLTHPAKLKQVENLPALPYTQIAAFLVDLEKEGGIAARAMEFMILTATRTGEVRGALWDEINMEDKSLTIPAARMKMKREHRVPLCDRAVAIVRAMEKLKTEEQLYVFPGGKPGKAMSEGALLAVLRRMERTDITPHGFRSTFRDWASECTTYSHEVQEMALAHSIKNKAEAAYRRGDLFDKRRRLMDDWQCYGMKALEPKVGA